VDDVLRERERGCVSACVVQSERKKRGYVSLLVRERCQNSRLQSKVAVQLSLSSQSLTFAANNSKEASLTVGPNDQSQASGSSLNLLPAFTNVNESPCLCTSFKWISCVVSPVDVHYLENVVLAVAVILIVP
jgi:hypothetical protein